MTYRLVYADTGIPCSDWSDDAEHFLRYLANRPDFVPKIIVMVEEGTAAPYKEWTGLKDFVAGINTDRLVVDEGIHVSLTPEDMKTLDEGMAHMEAQIDAAEKEGKVLVLNANGKPMFVPKAEAWQYNGNDDEGVMVFGEPPEDSDDRADEFEAAADTADALEKLNADKPNDVRDDIFITKSET